MSLMLSGTGVSRGIAIGKVRLLHEIQPRVTASHIEAGTVDHEVQRVTDAMHAAITELRELQSRLKDKVPGEILSFFDSHLLMLEDRTLSQPVIDLIREQHYSSEWALAVHRDALMKLFDRIEDPYLHQRAEDVENVIAKVLRKLSGAREPTTGAGDAYVVVTRSLAPADVIAHREDGMRALICTHGGTMSHATIVARSLRVPSIVAVHPALELLRESDRVIVDGDSGMIVAAPDPRSLRYYKRRRRLEKQRQRELRALADRAAITQDGLEVELLANVDKLRDASKARRAGADGIGLFRTEPMFLNRDELPDEAEQLGIYRRAVRAMRGKPVTIRTMDIWPGGTAHGLPHHLKQPESPALGMRGIRLCLAHPEIFEPQLRAMLRASAAGPLRILLPMVTSLSELHEALAMIARVRDEVERSYAVAETIPIGLLVEVPAVAIACRMFVAHVDFLAIGSNDLAQYTLAVDREDDDVQNLYDPLHPAVLRLMVDIIKTGSKAGKPVMLCGELASDPRVCRLLLGLGLRHLSVHPSVLLEVKNTILHTDVAQIAALTRQALRSENPARTEKLLERLAASAPV